MDDFPQSMELRVAIALVIGLVIGAEREQRMTEGAHAAAGIRTFTITALLGAVAMLLDQPVALGLFGAAVAAGALLSYALGDRTKDSGLTSEIALILTFALGALAIRHPMLSLGVGITTALLLAFRATIHDVVREVLTPTELRDALIVAAAALVVMPLAPNETVDPWGVLNPFLLLRLIVVILVIHLAAHVAQRMIGPRWGLAIAGLASGFVSSSATIAAMGKKAAEDEAQTRPAIAAATASTIATFVQLAVLVGAASTGLLVELAVPLAAGGVTALAYAVVFALRAARGGGSEVQPMRSAVDLKGAVLFALLVTAVTIGASVIQAYAGSSGVVIAAAIAAFADAHAAAASIASVHAAEHLASDAAIVAVLACLSTNTITKVVLAFSSGPRSYAVPVLIGLALVIGATWGAWVVQAVLGGAL